MDWNYEERLTEVFFYGGDGDDSEGITFFARDKAYGGAGNDVLGGNAGFLDGGTGNDILFSGNKTLAYGGAGSDILQGASGSTLDGGAGIDYVVAVDDFVLPHDVTLVGIEGVAINDIRCTIDALSPISRLKGIRSFDEAKIELVGGGKIDFGDFSRSRKSLCSRFRTAPTLTLLPPIIRHTFTVDRGPTSFGAAARMTDYMAESVQIASLAMTAMTNCSEAMATT